MKKLFEYSLLLPLIIFTGYSSTNLFNEDEKPLISKSQKTEDLFNKELAEKKLNLGRECFIKYDYKQAHIYFDEAANLGNGIAAYNLGLIYEMGYDGARNPQQAVYWYTQATKLGYNGPYLEKNLARAIKSMANNLPAIKETETSLIKTDKLEEKISKQKCKMEIDEDIDSINITSNDTSSSALIKRPTIDSYETKKNNAIIPNSKKVYEESAFDIQKLSIFQNNLDDKSIDIQCIKLDPKLLNKKLKDIKKIILNNDKDIMTINNNLKNTYEIRNKLLGSHMSNLRLKKDSSTISDYLNDIIKLNTNILEFYKDLERLEQLQRELQSQKELLLIQMKVKSQVGLKNNPQKDSLRQRNTYKFFFKRNDDLI